MANLLTGDTAVDFTLPATNGETYNLHDAFRDAKAVIVVFTCNHCPYARAWEDRINAIARDYASQGVRLFAINANDAILHPGDSLEQMVKRSVEKEFVFPYLHDETQVVAHAYGAERTPEVFVFDAAAKLRYHGAPDDNYEDEHAVKHAYVREALDAILADQNVATAETKPVGCTIKWKQ
ncbi:MAG TPA: thioredoxin family protein [Ktedonobacteraceae bacterium]|nr:thioredoxin family protein [Ktedonobacteraceae bacterium]